MDKLIVYDWPGNVRELANVERALVFGDGPKLVAGDLPMKITASASATATAVSPISGRSMTTAGI
jgi:DNA-binding NtrC family response regulator